MIPQQQFRTWALPRVLRPLSFKLTPEKTVESSFDNNSLPTVHLQNCSGYVLAVDSEEFETVYEVNSYVRGDFIKQQSYRRHHRRDPLRPFTRSGGQPPQSFSSRPGDSYAAAFLFTFLQSSHGLSGRKMRASQIRSRYNDVTIDFLLQPVLVRPIELWRWKLCGETRDLRRQQGLLQRKRRGVSDSRSRVLFLFNTDSLLNNLSKSTQKAKSRGFRYAQLCG